LGYTACNQIEKVLDDLLSSQIEAEKAQEKILEIVDKKQNSGLEIHWLTAFCENKIDGNGYVPDDIITSYSGQTVEIQNTDAEGRLTLMDMLSFATVEIDPDYIIDMATLTGACVMANGHTYTGMMSNDKILSESLMQTLVENGEHTSLNPLSEFYRKFVKSEIADLTNTSKMDRYAGHITAGLFLSHFVDQNNFRRDDLVITDKKSYPWVHLDIAGSSNNKKKNTLNYDGSTGHSIRSLFEFLVREI
jgi:leucyl aminopeptidase